MEPGEAEALGAPGALGYVPVAIKDNMDHPRFHTRLGAPYAQYKPSHMDPLTSRLVAAGAAVIGKTSMHELALGTTNVNPHYGTPENPTCPGRIPGGSSGGSAAAVAAGTVPLATGNDAGGSVRLPAAYTGVTGFKPSRGYLPTAGSPRVETLAAPGLIAATPLDVVLAVEAIRPGEAGRILAAAGELRESHLGPRVLVPVDLLERAEPSVGEAFRDALEALEAAGWRAVRARLALPREAENARVAATLLEALQDLQGLYEAHRQEMGEDIRFLLDIASHMPPWALASARRLLGEVRAAVRGRLEAYDAILLPTAPQEPPRIEEADWRLSASTRLIEYTAPLNTLDLPAISIPAGPRLPCGAPLGLQLASAHGDAYTLALALEAWRILAAEA
ncbi:MAG: amidase [Desulfurococcales archaeon]|nr:amidase [Desulfurococcales archaeon]